MLCCALLVFYCGLKGEKQAQDNGPKKRKQAKTHICLFLAQFAYCHLCHLAYSIGFFMAHECFKATFRKAGRDSPGCFCT